MPCQSKAREKTGKLPDLRGAEGVRLKVDLLVAVTRRSVKEDAVILFFPDRRKLDLPRTVQAEHHPAGRAAGVSQDVFRGRKGVGEKLVVPADGSVNKVLKVVKSPYRGIIGADHKILDTL